MSNELYHAWLKKGETSDDHKYIRREWKNGRWVYYYEDKKGNRHDSKIFTKAADKVGLNVKGRMDAAAKRISELGYDPKKAIVKSGATGQYETSWKLAGEVTSRASKSDDKTLSSSERYKHYQNALELSKAGREYANAMNAYRKHRISDIVESVEKGKAYLDRLFD